MDKKKMRKHYQVTEKCISCHACVEVAENNFEIVGNGLAFVKKQPQNQIEEEQCEEALNVCPVGAIVAEDLNAESTQESKEPILASSKVKETLDKYPELKNVLTGLSPKFNKLLNPVMYNSLARFASFSDASRVTGISICEILFLLNDAIGTTDKLHKIAPECIKEKEADEILSFSSPITWAETSERYIYNADSMPEIIEKVINLNAQENIVIISVKEPIELIKTAKGLGLELNVEKSREYRVSVYNNAKITQTSWKERKGLFEQLDVRRMLTDPFDVIIQKAYSTKEGDGFILIQRFEPFPLMNMFAEMGFEFESEYQSDQEIWVYFYKTPVSKSDKTEKSSKTEIIIQSATPVAYPVIMRLLQSELIRKKVAIKELKVWEETEKHLAWITNGKADISFSAVITAAKLRNSDIKIPALFVWDNFVILTRYEAKNFDDLVGKEIHTPLFEEAPPAKITKYLMKASGFNPDDFNFVYGKPFGRPEQIYADFVNGNADTVILREPEASYAIKIMQDRNENISVLSYNEMWNKINPGFGSFPNAGIVIKGEFARKNPELCDLFLIELKNAIDWVNKNKKEAAKLAFDMMRQPIDRIELFLDRVKFNYVSGTELIEKVKDYFDVLARENIVDYQVDDDFYDIFK